MIDNVFPETIYTEDGKNGLTKRELFAAMAMQGLLAAVYSNKEMLNEFTKTNRGHVSGREAITENALSYADGLIKALAEGDSKSAG